MARRCAEGDQESGFTVIEVSVAIALFAIIIVGVAASAMAGMTLVGRSSARQVAVQLAGKELEELRALPYGELGHTTAPASAAAPSPNARISGGNFNVPDVGPEVLLVDAAFKVNPQTEAVTTEDIRFTVYRYVTSAPGSLKRVTVTVTWEGSSRTVPNRVDASTLVSTGALTW